MKNNSHFSDGIPDLSSVKLRDRIVSSLTDMILESDLKPGDQLPSQQELTEKLGVSRVVLREAVQWLEAQGLVKAVSGKGVIIKSPDLVPVLTGLKLFLRRHLAGLADLWEVRNILEPEVAALAAQKATPEQLEAMAEAVSLIKTSSDISTVVEAEMRFHRLLAESTDNMILKALSEACSTLIRESIEKTTAAGLPTYDHSPILEAVRSGDPEAAREVMRGHMASSQKRLGIRT